MPVKSFGWAGTARVVSQTKQSEMIRMVSPHGLSNMNAKRRPRGAAAAEFNNEIPPDKRFYLESIVDVDALSLTALLTLDNTEHDLLAFGQ